MKNTKIQSGDKTPKEKVNATGVSGAAKAQDFLKKKSGLLIAGCVVAIVVVAIIWVVCANLGKSNNGAFGNSKGRATCAEGATDMLSDGEWIVGEDVVSGDYLIEAKDGYAYVYIYKDSDTSDYENTFSLNKSSSYVHFENGQKVEVSSGNIDLVCQNFDGLGLLSSGTTASAGNYTLMAVNDYLYAYVYENEDNDSYEASLSIKGVGETKDFRFKDGQYIEVSGGSAFLIDKNASNYDDLVSEAKKLVDNLGTAKDEKKEESKSSSTTSSLSAASSSSSSTSSASSSSSSTDASFRKAMDDYESFMDKYVDFMTKYKNSSDTASMLTDYSKMMQDYAKFADSIKGYNQNNLSADDWEYYLEVTSRVTKKLAEVQ